MKKKLLAALLSVSMVAVLLAGCGNKAADNNAASDGAANTETAATDVDYGTGSITIWVSEETNAFTKAQADKFIGEHPEFSGYTVTVESVGEGDAASNMITDVEGGGRYLRICSGPVGTSGFFRCNHGNHW